MRKAPAFYLFIGLAALMLNACGGGDGNNTFSNAISENTTNNPPATENPDGSGGQQNTVSPGELGDLVDLGDLLAFTADPQPGDHWYYTRAMGINDSGTVIGQSNSGNPVKGAFLRDLGTESMTYLGKHGSVYEDYYGQYVETVLSDPSPFIYSEAVDINNSETVIGNSTTGLDWPYETETRAFVWKERTLTDLPPPPGNTIVNFDDLGNVTSVELDITSYSKAADINENGEVVFTADDATPLRHAYYWDGVSFHTVTLYREDGSTFDVFVPGPYKALGKIVGQSSEAVGINENHHAVVNSGGTAIFHDLNWDVIESLNHLPGAIFTAAVDINDSAFTNHDGIPDAHIIGNSGDVFDPKDLETALMESDVRGFFWDGGAMYPIDHLGGGTSVVTDINNNDQVVGGATTEEGVIHAYIWTLDENEKGVIHDLGTLGGANSFATAINEAGQVTGWSETGGTYEEEGVTLPIRHAFLWDSGVMYDLGTHDYFYDYSFTPPFPFSEGIDINNLGEVAGNSVTINDHKRGFFLSPVFP